MKKPTNHLQYLDGWRGLAILIVLSSHFCHPLYQFGGLGVGVFFVLSGYLMGDLLFIKKVALPYFFIRRISRIFPAFVVFLFAMVIYARWIQQVPYTPSSAEILSTLTFLGTYVPNNVNIWANTWPIAHMWSLNVEEHSYLWLALGVVITTGTNRNSKVMAFLLFSVAVTIVFIIAYRFWPPTGASRWELRSEVAAIGLISSATYRVILHYGLFKLKEKIPKFAPLVALFAAIYAYSSVPPVFVKQIAGPLLLAFAINHLDTTFDSVKKILSTRILTWFGTCSFSMYLWQQAFYLAYSRQHSIDGITALTLAVITGALSFYLIESPARVFLNKKFTTRKFVEQ